MTEWSLTNQLDFQSLRVEECDRLFSDLITKLCSPDRVNDAAQVALLEEVRALDGRIDTQTEAIQKLLQEVRQNGQGHDLSIVDVWGRKIPEEKRGLAEIGKALQALIKGEGPDQLENAVNGIDYELLQMEKPRFDKATYSPITFEYLRDRFDHCLSLLQNIFNFFLRQHMDPTTANQQMALIKGFNSDFELQKQNIKLYETQLFESLSFESADGAHIENQLNLLATFADTIDLWTKLPLNQISGTISHTADELPIHNNLFNLFKEIDFESIGVDNPTHSEVVTLKLNLRFFRPKFQTRNLAWMWVNKLKLRPKEEDEEDANYERQIPQEAIPDYFAQLETFMQNSETSIDTFIENLLTCEPSREHFDQLSMECENLKSLLRAQRPQIKSLKSELSQPLSDESLALDVDDDCVIVPASYSSSNDIAMRTRVVEWIQLVDIWLQVLDSLTGLLSHMTKGAESGEIDDVVDSLRQMIERDLFIPHSDTQNNEMEQ